jgi:hypothetical protein
MATTPASSVIVLAPRAASAHSTKTPITQSDSSSKSNQTRKEKVQPQQSKAQAVGDFLKTGVKAVMNAVQGKPNNQRQVETSIPSPQKVSKPSSNDVVADTGVKFTASSVDTLNTGVSDSARIGQVTPHHIKANGPAEKAVNDAIKKGGFNFSPEAVYVKGGALLYHENKLAMALQSKGVIPKNDVNKNILTRATNFVRSSVTNALDNVEADIRYQHGVGYEAGFVSNIHIRPDPKNNIKPFDRLKALAKNPSKKTFNDALWVSPLTAEVVPFSSLTANVSRKDPEKQLETRLQGGGRLLAGITGLGAGNNMENLRDGSVSVPDAIKAGGAWASRALPGIGRRGGAALDSFGTAMSKTPLKHVKAYYIGLDGTRTWRVVVSPTDAKNVDQPFSRIPAGGGSKSEEAHRKAYEVQPGSGLVTYRSPNTKTFEGEYRGPDSKVVIDPSSNLVKAEDRTFAQEIFGSTTRDPKDVIRTIHQNVATLGPEYKALQELTEEQLIALNPQAVQTYGDKTLLSDQRYQLGMRLIQEKDAKDNAFRLERISSIYDPGTKTRVTQPSEK